MNKKDNESKLLQDKIKNLKDRTIDILKADWKWFDADGLHKDDTILFKGK